MKKKALLCFLSISLGINGCSYKKWEDSVHKSLQGDANQAEDYVNPASIPNTASASPSTHSASDSSGVVRQVGETITCIDVMGDEVQYTLHDVEIVDSIHELGISSEDLINTSLIGSNGKILEKDGDKNCFVAVNVTVKNCNIDISQTPQGQYPMLIEMCSGSESNILSEDGPFLEYAVYFNGHPEMDGDENKDYYGFSLEKGEEMDAMIGWIIPQKMLEEPFYYIISGSGTAENYQYFLLNGD